MGCPLGPHPGPRARALPGPGLMLQGSAARPAVASPALGDISLEPCSDLAEFTGPGALGLGGSAIGGGATRPWGPQAGRDFGGDRADREEGGEEHDRPVLPPPRRTKIRRGHAAP